MRKIINFITLKLRFLSIKLKYKGCGNVKVYGKISLDSRNIKFGNNVSLYSGVQIWGNGQVIIGDNVAIGRNTIIFSDKKIIISDNVSIAGQCYIIDCDHGIKKNKLIREQELVSDEIYIGNDVWIGAGAKILRGTYLEDGCVVGAGSVVNNKLKTQKNEIYGGVPAKKISERK